MAQSHFSFPVTEFGVSYLVQCLAIFGVISAGGAENAGVENAGAITYGKPSEEKTLRSSRN